MVRFLAALRFLTILPVPGKLGSTKEAMVGSVPFFPLVGLLIGAVAAAAAFGLSDVFSAAVTAVLTVVVLLGASGGFHLDGLSDTFDGLLSARPKERILEILRDSHVGVMGVIAIVCVLALKIAALASLDRSVLWRAVFLMPVGGRCAMVVALVLLPAARPGDGLGSLFCKTSRPVHAILGILVLAVAAWLTATYAGLVAAGAALVLTLVFCAYSYRRIGGATGDTVGATCEIVEAGIALAFAAGPVASLIG